MELSKRFSLSSCTIATLLFFTSQAYCSDKYWLCGPDEDGCYKGIYEYCSCTPYDDLQAEKPYCLDFEKLGCFPLTQIENCHPLFIFPNQQECLATLFQSMPTPPCTLTTHSFCMQHHSPICDPTGHPQSCHS